MRCVFASDLHGRADRYRKLMALVAEERPDLVLLGGDLLPNAFDQGSVSQPRAADFLGGFVAQELGQLRATLGPSYPRFLAILGNDDPRTAEADCLALAEAGLWEYCHQGRVELGEWRVYGYSCVSPSPFLLKDWERYDVSRYVDPGCMAPEEGLHTVPFPEGTLEWGTIAADLEELTGDEDLSRAILLFHAPPYRTKLDRAALDGKRVDHVPLDVHCGSIAIRRLIEDRQPAVSLHGHIHESARLTGSWRDQLGRTECFSAAHDGPELAVVRFDPEEPQAATRELR